MSQENFTEDDVASALLTENSTDAVALQALLSDPSTRDEAIRIAREHFRNSAQQQGSQRQNAQVQDGQNQSTQEKIRAVEAEIQELEDFTDNFVKAPDKDKWDEYQQKKQRLDRARHRHVLLKQDLTAEQFAQQRQQVQQPQNSQAIIRDYLNSRVSELASVYRITDMKAFMQTFANVMRSTWRPEVIQDPNELSRALPLTFDAAVAQHIKTKPLPKHNMKPGLEGHENMSNEDDKYKDYTESDKFILRANGLLKDEDVDGKELVRRTDLIDEHGKPSGEGYVLRRRPTVLERMKQ